MMTQTGSLGKFSIRELQVVSQVFKRLRLGWAMHEIYADFGDRYSMTSLSRLLTDFSDAFGVRLTERRKTRGGPLSLSSHGLEHYERIVRAIEDVVAIVSQLAGNARGQARGLTIGLVGGLVPEFVPRLLEPDVEGLGYEIGGVVARPEDQIVSALQTGSVDLMIIPSVRRRQVAPAADPPEKPHTTTELNYVLPLGVLCKTNGAVHKRLLALSSASFEAGLKDVIESSPIALNCGGHLDRGTLALLGVKLINTRYEVSDYRAIREIVAARDVLGFGTADHGRQDVTYFPLSELAFPFVLHTTLVAGKPASLLRSLRNAITRIHDAVTELSRSRSPSSDHSAQCSEDPYVHNPYA